MRPFRGLTPGRAVDRAPHEREKMRIYKQIASSWLDIEAVRKAREALAGGESSFADK